MLAPLITYPAIVYLAHPPIAALYFYRCAWLIVHSILQEELVNTGMIYGAVIAYMLIGIGWSALYGIIDLTEAEAFYLSENVAGERGAALVYFSFVTMTTLSLGDIQPTAGIARTATYLQAVAGVKFGAIFVAAVVGYWKRGCSSKTELGRLLYFLSPESREPNNLISKGLLVSRCTSR